MIKLALIRPPQESKTQISSLELPASEIAAQINASQSSSNRHILILNINCSEETGLHSRIAAKTPVLKDTNKKRLAWAKKHEQLDRCKSVL